LELEQDGKPEVRRAQRTSLGPDQLADAEAALQSIGDRKLAQVVAHYLNLEGRALAKGIDLDGALAFVEARYRPEIQEKSVLTAYDEFIETRFEVASATRKYYEASLRCLLKPEPNKTLHSFTVGEIEKILSHYKNASSRRSYHRAFGTFFNWAVRHHYCLENPCDRLDKIPAPATEIAILSIDEVKRLLQAAVEYADGSMAPVVAIALFAGLRPSEIRDLKPKDINGERIRVSGGKMRRKLKRVFPMPDNLKLWLKKHPFVGLPDGYDYRLKILKGATKAKKWVQDVMRHTSISFQAERDKNEGLTAFKNGTSKEMMDRHYRDVIDDPGQVEDYWSLTPAKLAREKIQVKLPRKDDREWPSKARLKKMVWQRAMIHVAKDLGVSDVALKKHCVKAGIELPSRGYWVRENR
jgi:integrase